MLRSFMSGGPAVGPVQSVCGPANSLVLAIARSTAASAACAARGGSAIAAAHSTPPTSPPPTRTRNAAPRFSIFMVFPPGFCRRALPAAAADAEAAADPLGLSTQNLQRSKSGLLFCDGDQDAT